jgi:high-affinity nickel-transport protein
MSRGIDVALLVTTFGLGLRHGVDWDHLAAITDLTGAELDRRRSASLAVLYALGHGLAVFVLGAVAIALGDRLPDWTDPVMERVVGATLVALAVVLVASLWRGRTTSRGMLLLHGLQRLRASLRRTRTVTIEHDHGHGHGEGAGAHDHVHPEPVAATSPQEPERERRLLLGHRHRHVHAVTQTRYGRGGSLAVGVLHGVGAETGTQAVVLVSAAQVTSTGTGIAILGAFVAGILVTTGGLALAVAAGWSGAARHPGVLRASTAVGAALSAGIGLHYLLG